MISRRRFLRGAASACAAAALLPELAITARWPAAVVGARALRSLRIVHIIGSDVPTSARMGGELGASEAAQAARLLGWTLSAGVHVVRDARHAIDAVQHDLEVTPAVMVVSGDAGLVRALAGWAAERALLLLNAAAHDDALREPPCSGSTFHVMHSERMRQAALRAVAAPPGQSAGGDAAAVLWHGSLFRYGAEQLNDRYRVRFQQPMDAIAWAAWMSMKVAWESVARVRSAELEPLARYLLGRRARFDGHKGIELTFRAADRQLRQPMYVLTSGSDDAAPIEVPRVAAAAERDAEEVLDELGAPAASCEPAPEG